MDRLQAIRDRCKDLREKVPDAVYVEDYLADVEYLLKLLNAGIRAQAEQDKAVKPPTTPPPFGCTFDE